MCVCSRVRARARSTDIRMGRRRSAQFRFPFTWRRKHNKKKEEDQSTNLHIGCWPQQRLWSARKFRSLRKCRSEIEGRMLLKIREEVPLGFKCCAIFPVNISIFMECNRTKVEQINKVTLKLMSHFMYLFLFSIHRCTKNTKVKIMPFGKSLDQINGCSF